MQKVIQLSRISNHEDAIFPYAQIVPYVVTHVKLPTAMHVFPTALPAQAIHAKIVHLHAQIADQSVCSAYPNTTKIERKMTTSCAQHVSPQLSSLHH